MKERRLEWVMIVLIGSLLLGIIPSAASWGTVYAGSDQGVVTTAEQIQSKLVNAMKSRIESLTFNYKGRTAMLRGMLNKAVTAALEVDVYTKYVVDSYSFTWRGTENAAAVAVRLIYRETPAQTSYVNARVKQIAKELIKPGMDDHAKIKVIHDWIVLNLKYDTALRKYTAYEGLKSGEAVCQGYSLLTYKLLKEASIANLIVEGTAGGQLHAWNLIKLQGNWYHLDATWDDPTPDQAGQIHYNYYLRTDKQMAKDHTWTRKKYPAATVSYRDNLTKLQAASASPAARFYQSLMDDLGYNLYLAGTTVSSIEGIKSKVQEAMKMGRNSVSLRYSGSVDQLTEDLPHLYDLNIRHITYFNEPLEDTPDLKVRLNWES
ncbi:transglutaminase domain-containing protein [Paenibacillus sp. J22TS3]|uniref:transglutaminase domain-containing protein n=1 Tax=Paenibacillus sp. J22TS3 TaxID=2807192 RepID=UPI001B1A2874|nr:transglutaminase domain-containing protein [Paenibacillus sp. J22TS3]GIP24425.1 peptidase [Paenibacillus sp. J22TS3]